MKNSYFLLQCHENSKTRGRVSSKKIIFNYRDFRKNLQNILGTKNSFTLIVTVFVR